MAYHANSCGGVVGCAAPTSHYGAIRCCHTQANPHLAAVACTSVCLEPGLSPGVTPLTSVDPNAATWFEAELECSSQGHRLCSDDELHVCCGTGCGHDARQVWSRTDCSPPLPPGPPPSPRPSPPVPPAPPAPSAPPLAPLAVLHEVVNGCSGPTPEECRAATELGGVRCCAGAEGSGECLGSVCTKSSYGTLDPIGTLSDMEGGLATLYEATLECRAQGGRLCTPAELQERLNR